MFPHYVFIIIKITLFAKRPAAQRKERTFYFIKILIPPCSGFKSRQAINHGTTKTRKCAGGLSKDSLWLAKAARIVSRRDRTNAKARRRGACRGAHSIVLHSTAYIHTYIYTHIRGGWLCGRLRLSSTRHGFAIQTPLRSYNTYKSRKQEPPPSGRMGEEKLAICCTNGAWLTVRPRINVCMHI